MPGCWVGGDGWESEMSISQVLMFFAIKNIPSGYGQFKKKKENQKIRFVCANHLLRDPKI